MTDVTIRSLAELDPAFFARKGIKNLDLRSLELDELPAGLGAFDELEKLELHHCTVKAFHPGVFTAGSKAGKLEVELSYCKFDADGLFEKGLVHGLGTWRVQDYGFDYQRDPRWKRLASIADDGVGDEAFRRAAYVLAGKGTIEDAAPSEVHLRLLDHSKKPIREKVALYLDQKLPSPLASGAVKPGTRVLVLGAPIHHDKDGLKARLEALGLQTAKALKDAGAVLLLPKPGAKLADALAAGLPVLVEGHLEAAAKPAEAPPAAATAQEGESLDRLLFNADPKNVLLGLSLAKARALEGKLLADVVAVAFFSTDAAVRKEGKALLLSSAPEVLRGRLQGDKRNYASLDDGAKLTKLVKELAGFGVDAADFSIAMLRTFAGRESVYGGTFEGALEAALAQPGNSERAFEALADQPEIYLPVKKTFPKGLSKLRALTKLRIPHATVTSDANIAELAELPNDLELDYWVKDTKLEHLRSIAHKVTGLYLRGAYSNLTDIRELARFEKLTRLFLEETGVTDITPLAGLRLVFLKLSQTPVTSIEPLRGMTTLEGLYLSRVKCDLAPIAGLTNLTNVDLSGTDLQDLGLLAGLDQLVKLDLWGCAVTDLGPLAGKPLERLSLNYLPVTPDLRALFDVPTLGALDLVGTKVDEAQLADLRAKLPDLYVNH